MIIRKFVAIVLLPVIFLFVQCAPSYSSGGIPVGGTNTTIDGDSVIPIVSGDGFKTKSPDNTKPSTWKTDSFGRILLTRGKNYRAFGDSLTAGNGASIEAKRFPNLIATQLEQTLTNDGVAGYMVMDMNIGKIYPYTPDADVYTVLAGNNDFNGHGSDTNAFLGYKRGTLASFLWLLMPQDNIIETQESGWSFTGVWTNENLFTNVNARYTSAVNATAEITIRGTAIYILYIKGEAADCGSFKIEIDAVNYTPTPIDTCLGANGNIFTGKAPYALRFGGLKSGSHTVVITNTIDTKVSEIGYIASNDRIVGQASIDKTKGPNLFVGSAINLPAWINGSEALLYQYNDAKEEIVAQLKKDGFNIEYVDLNAAYNIVNTNFPLDIHPNDLGYAQIAEAFIGGISQAPALSGIESGKVSIKEWSKFFVRPTAGCPTPSADEISRCMSEDADWNTGGNDCAAFYKLSNGNTVLDVVIVSNGGCP